VDETVQGQRRPRAEIHRRQRPWRHPDRAAVAQGERGQHEDGTGETDQVDEIHGPDPSGKSQQREVRLADLRVQSDCMHISPDRLLILRAVSASGGVGAAARQLHLAPSGISQHLARLERETGLVLVDRFHSGGQRPLRLTAAGQRLAAHGGRLAEVLADAADDVYAMSGRLSGTANIGAYSSVMTRLVVPAIRALEQRAPGVQVRVHEAGESVALSALRGGDLDVALVEDENLVDRSNRPGLQHTWLLDDPYRVVVPAAWPVPRSLDDLADRPWVSGPPGTAVHLVLNRIRRSTGLALAATHVCEEFAAVLALVEAGLGASIIPALALPVEKRPGLHLVGLSEFGVRHISAVTVATRRQPPLITEMLHALVEAASGSA
jgi:DNA-binding transcriptional LysR family regulator